MNRSEDEITRRKIQMKRRKGSRSRRSRRKVK
jgi:hypothetical protein